MGDTRRASILDILRGRNKDSKRDPQHHQPASIERQVSVSSQINTSSEGPAKLTSEKEGKQRKPVERRESSRLQSAAKLLRSLSKTKDVKSSASQDVGQSKVNKAEADPREVADFPERGHPAYLSEGKGPRKRKNSGKENKEGKGKDRSHSFHGKLDKKERKYLALERQQKGEEALSSPQCNCEETVVSGARSILLTEDNLNPISQAHKSSPDLIQDLPSQEEAATNKDQEKVIQLASPEDDDYVEADSVALDISEVEAEIVGQDENVGSPRLAGQHSSQVRHQLQLQQNYCNLLPSQTEYDPTYASIDDYQHSFLHTNTSWISNTTAGLDDDYTNHLRSSSYAMLRPGPEQPSGPLSMLQQERFTGSRAGSRASSRAGLRTASASVFQSLPYMAGSQVTSQVSSPVEEVRELEEYARQYEVAGRGCGRAARATPASGRDSVMTITSSVLSGQSDSSGDTLRPGPVSVSSSHSELTNTEGREEVGHQVYTRMRPIFHHGYNDGRRKSDYYSFTTGYRPRSEQSSEAACSVSDRISQMERLSRENTNNKEKTAKMGSEETDYNGLSKSVPNLLSEEDGTESLADTETSYTYLDPEKKLKVTDNTLKLIQKQAVLDYYTRQKKSSTDLTKLTKRADSSQRSEEGEEAEKEGSKNSSFESERCFIRSISQGSLSQLSQSYQNSESYNSSSTGPLAKIGSHSPTVFNSFSKYQKSNEIPNQDVSPRCDNVNNDSFLNSETNGHGWKKRLEKPAESNGHLSAGDHLKLPRSPSPDLPPPPPLADCEVLQNDSPLPPPPLRIEEEADKARDKSSNNGKSRRSPATLAARGAPGWERFLGGTTSSVTFTSDEARKFRRTKDRQRARGVEAGPKSLPFVFGKDSLKPLQPAKSSPSLNEKEMPGQPQWWKTSMDSLRLTGGTGECRTPLMAGPGTGGEKESSGTRGGVNHSHSSSDSGLSSLSGRTSCMSPLSVVSTTSSASSGSSRASLRSASIVSTSTIPLDEDEERELPGVVKRNQTHHGKVTAEDLISRTALELFSLVPAPHNVASLFGSEGHHNRIMAQYLRGVFNWDLDQLQEVVQRSDICPPPTPLSDLDAGNQDDQGQQFVRAKKCELEGFIRKRISSLKIEETAFKDRDNKNTEVGKFLLKRLSTEARQNEVDKYKLHVDEVDKITSLLLGLSSRLARSEISLINLKKNCNEDEEENLKNKREKLLEQLEEAKTLKSSIDKRGNVVTSLLLQYLTEAEFEQYKTFMKTKTLLLVQTKLVSERQQQSQQQLEGLSLHRFVL